MSTAIKSAHSKRTITIDSDRNLTYLDIRDADGTLLSIITVNTAELHKALGINKLGCGCDEADSNLAEALKRAEDAEAEALEQAQLVRTWADRAEKAGRSRNELAGAWASVCEHMHLDPDDFCDGECESQP